MVTETVKELKAAKAKLAELENTLARERANALSQLPAEYGFESTEEFITALREAVGGGGAGAGRRKGARKSAPVAAPKKRGKRARITPEVKDKVKSLVASGQTGQQIAKSLGISVPSVQNIKKELGLVKARK